jgi:hypothetical protein
MIEGIINGLEHFAVAMFAVVVIVGILMDYPAYKRKKKLEKCAKGQHHFKDWRHMGSTHYGDKDVYQQECRNCGIINVVISRLHPDTLK